MMIHPLARLICLTLVLLALGCQRQAPQSPVGAKQPELTAQTVEKTLAQIAPDEQPDVEAADNQHVPKTSAEDHMVIDINRYGNGVAYIARTAAGVHVVHNGTTGKNFQEVDSTTLTVSRDGKRVAYCAKAGDKWFIVVDGREFGPYDDKGPPVFSPDSAHVAYEAKEGDAWRMHCDAATSGTAASFSDKPLFSGNSERLMRMENNPDGRTFRVIISDLKFRPLAEHTFNNLSYLADPTGQRIFVIDRNQSKFQVKTLSFSDPKKVVPGALYDSILNPVFSPDGRKFSFIAKKDGKDFLVVDGNEAPIPSGLYPWPPVLAADGSAGVIIVGKTGAFPYRAFNGRKILVPGTYKECADLTFSPDGRGYAYVAIKNEHFLIVSDGVEGPVYDRVISPQFTPDGSRLVYRARKGGKRFVVVADPKTGKVLKEFPKYERVFETIFTADGKSVAYGVKEGNQIMWKVEKLDE